MREITGYLRFEAADVSAVLFPTSVVDSSRSAFCFAFAELANALAFASAAQMFELRAIGNSITKGAADFDKIWTKKLTTPERRKACTQTMLMVRNC